jgi:hypothetical protein
LTVVRMHQIYHQLMLCDVVPGTLVWPRKLGKHLDVS